MMRKLVKTDIESVISRVDEWRNCKISFDKVENGITNPNFIVKTDNKSYFVKIPGAGTEEYIDRDNCNAASRIAMESSSGPGVFRYFSDTGVEIWEWLEGYRQLKFSDVYNKDIFTEIARVIRRFHKYRKIELPVKETLFDQARKMIERTDALGYKPPWHDRIQFLLETIEDAVNTCGIDWSPAHNDLWTNNMMYNKETGDLKIIDFEYATMSDPYNDLGCFSTSNYLTEAMDVELCRIYHNGWDEKGFARIKLYKIIADIKWGYWALQQSLYSDIDFDYMEWYGVQFSRLLHTWQDPRLDYWINLLKGTPVFMK